MMIGRLREPGQELLGPQREETRCLALQLVFFPPWGLLLDAAAHWLNSVGSQRTCGPLRQPECRGEGQTGDVWGISEVGLLLPDSASMS